MSSNLDREKKLLPDRHPQQELFLCDLGDIAIKDDTASMEHPIFSLSTNTELAPRKYQNGDVTLEVSPGSHGLATIWDKDVLIFAISKLMKMKKEGEQISPSVAFDAKDFLVFANRATGGADYDRLRAAMLRLDGTRLNTTIQTGGETEFKTFGLIEGARIKRKDSNGKVLSWGMKLSDWVFRAIEADEVLTLHPEYFRLRKGMERRIYEIARKHCGRQQEWRISVQNLRKKSGAKSHIREFKSSLKEIEAFQTLPDYKIYVLDKSSEEKRKEDVVLFVNRGTIKQAGRIETDLIVIDPETLEIGKRLAIGWCMHNLQREFREWVASEKIAVKDADALFLSLCEGRGVCDGCYASDEQKLLRDAIIRCKYGKAGRKQAIKLIYAAMGLE